MANIKSFIVNKFQALVFKGSNHAPEVMVVAGTGLLLTAGVWAAKKAYDYRGVVEAYREEEARIEDNECDPEMPNYTHDTAELDHRDNKADLVKETVVTFAGPVAVAALGGVAVLYGHNLRNKRYLAAAAAWAASQADYKALLDRIRRDYGEDEEKRLKYDIEEKTENHLNDDGTASEKNYALAKNPPSLYARIFDETCVEWRKDPIHNMAFIRRVQDEANKTLRERGFITLNEVYQALGFEQNASYGNEAGWIKGAGDDFVDFGIFDDYDNNERKRAFINGYERSILLDFNCIGRIREYA